MTSTMTKGRRDSLKKASEIWKSEKSESMGTSNIAVTSLDQTSRTGSSTSFDMQGSSSELFTSTRGSSSAMSTAMRLSYSPSKRKTNCLDEFTVNKLNFDKLDLYGRDGEVEQLKQAFETSKTTKQLVLLSGYSGVGKTRLARVLEKDVQRQNGLYVEGKIDQNVTQSKPYSALSTVCGTICARILSLENADAIRTQLEETLGSELPTLLGVFPILEELFVNSITTASRRSSHDLNQNPEEAKFRLKYAFCRFLRVVCQELAPIVLVLDDLQWADLPSIGLFESIVSDNNTKMMMIGTYRTSEVEDGHPLASCLSYLRDRSQNSDAFDMLEIAVENLDFDAIVLFINDLLSTSDSKALGLASLCEKRTLGNVFFLTHFLIHLRSKEMLQYNFGSLKWTWDESEIEKNTSPGGNVVDLLLMKMQSAPKEQVEVLRLAACMGADVDEKVLSVLWTALHRDSERANDYDRIEELKSCIEASVLDGYLCTINAAEGNYAFVHDKVQEAASLLTPKDDAQKFQKWVGQTLLERLQPEDLGASLFIVTNLLNEGDFPNEGEKRLELAELNCQASMKAMKMSAFEAVSRYAAVGISLLPDDAFSKHTELALDLYSTGAAAESCLGHTEKMESYCKLVMNQAGVAIEDKLRVYTTWLDSIANRGGDFQGAIEETTQLLKKFNVRFPRNKLMQTFSFLSNITKVKKGLKGDLLKRVVELPVDKDITRRRILHLMDRLSVYLYYVHDDRMPLVMFRNFQWTLKYGMNDITPSSLNTLAIILGAFMGDIQAGSACSQAALDLLPKVSPLVEGRTLFVAHAFGVVWTQPLRSQLKPLQRAYEAGICAGDAESACWAIMGFYHSRYLLSFPLDLVIADVEVYVAQMKDLNQIVAYRSAVVNYQMFMNLAGKTDTEPLSLVGDILTAKNHMLWLETDPFYEAPSRLWEGYIRTLYGEHEECAKMAVQYGSYTSLKSNPSAFSIALFEVFSKGISSFVAARTATEKRKRKGYRKIAVEIHRRVKNWINQGNPNLSHLDAFFDAEMAALAGKHFGAIKQYQVAIIVAARSGLLLDAGLFSEVFAEYLLAKGGEEEEAAFRLQEAVKYYSDFGAHRKLAMLEKKHGARVFPTTSEIFVRVSGQIQRPESRESHIPEAE